MCEVQGITEGHIGWIVRAGAMDFWHDNWLGSAPLCRSVEEFQDHRVADFVTGGEWDGCSLSQVLQPELVRLVMFCRPPPLLGEDRMVWSLTPNGEFTVSLAVAVVRGHSHRSFGTAPFGMSLCL